MYFDCISCEKYEYNDYLAEKLEVNVSRTITFIATLEKFYR